MLKIQLEWVAFYAISNHYRTPFQLHTFLSFLFFQMKISSELVSMNAHAFVDTEVKKLTRSLQRRISYICMSRKSVALALLLNASCMCGLCWL